jgi:transposase-like protein
VALGQRERHEDWLELGRGLAARGLRSPLLVVADGAPGRIGAVTELWPEAERQRGTVHRLRHVLAKLPQRDDLQAEGPGRLLGRARWTDGGQAQVTEVTKARGDERGGWTGGGRAVVWSAAMLRGFRITSGARR